MKLYLEQQRYSKRQLCAAIRSLMIIHEVGEDNFSLKWRNDRRASHIVFDTHLLKFFEKFL